LLGRCLLLRLGPLLLRLLSALTPGGNSPRCGADGSALSRLAAKEARGP
jgi:hypothetical protein